MRIKLQLNRTGRQRMLPMNYQSFIQAWIYKVLFTADAEFATFLHDKGYGDQFKPYKLFCFNRLNIGKPILWKEKQLFEVKKQVLELELSFYLPEIASNFIKGLFKEQDVYLGDRFNGLDLHVAEVTVLETPQFSETMHYKLHSPWVLSKKYDNSKHATYITPEHEEFINLSKKHIAEKWNTLHSEESIELNQIDFRPKEEYRRRGFTLKPDSKDQTKVIGNVFDFTLTAPLGIHEMIYGAGCSEKSASGFGWTVSLE